MARPAPAQERAAHVEIKQRYGRRWANETKPDRIKAVRRRQVLNLLRHRHAHAGDADAGDPTLVAPAMPNDARSAAA
jgi:hypothetical protein